MGIIARQNLKKVSYKIQVKSAKQREAFISIITTAHKFKLIEHIRIIRYSNYSGVTMKIMVEFDVK